VGQEQRAGRDRPVILFDDAGVAGSGGQTPDTIEALGDDTAAFIGALGLPQAASRMPPTSDACRAGPRGRHPLSTVPVAALADGLG
jgi:hypothetical protein